MKDLKEKHLLHIQQLHEAFELLGFETRNKYQILDEYRNPLAFAAEKSTGFTGTILRQVLGHWRSFDVIIYDEERKPLYKMSFPFRWFWKTLYLSTAEGQRIGHLKQRFALFRKKFDLYDTYGKLIANINSSFFRFWTFEFQDPKGRSLGKIEKKWAGVLSEAFTDKDNFIITFRPGISHDTRVLMLATCIMVDIIYFENNKVELFD
jgi:uncharacterized protein YxjI